MTIRRQRTAAMPIAMMMSIFLLSAVPSRGWDEKGHQIIAQSAWKSLPETMPKWLGDPEIGKQLVYLSTESDRWRGQHSPYLDHINNLNHYMDIEHLEPFGLSLQTLPRFRREFLDTLAIMREKHPDRFEAYDRKRDRAYTRKVPGILPYRIVELQWKLSAGWTTLKTYEQHRDLVTDDMIRFARGTIIHTMGILSHYVADAAQPLHTTQHYNGWIGDNPNGYTTERTFHRFIDGGVIELHDISANSLTPKLRKPRRIAREDSWSDVLAYINASFAQVEPLYQMEKSGKLRQADGKVFIEERLIDASDMLAAIWTVAYENAVIDDFRVRQLRKSATRTSPNHDD